MYKLRIIEFSFLMCFCQIVRIINFFIGFSTNGGIGFPCTINGNCLPANTECWNNVCTCTPGYVLDSSTQTCIAAIHKEKFSFQNYCDFDFDYFDFHFIICISISYYVSLGHN